jgi:curved DNA-binding protein CbpA
LSKDSFVDFYETLEISPNAQPETIQRVYRLLAQLYHPDNAETGDIQKFKDLTEAYRTLGDPEQRAAYDVEYEIRIGRRWKIFDQTSSVQGFEAEKRKRMGILSLLYTKRMHEPQSPTLNIIEMEQLLGCPREHLELSLWYLRESGRIQRSDNGKYALTARGLETLEESAENPLPSYRMLNAPPVEAEVAAGI